MAIGKYIPSVDSTIKIAVALVILFGLIKFLPIPENIKAMFRV